MAIKTVQAVVNGQTYTLSLNSSTGKYETTITAPNKSSYNQSGNYYNVSVKATDVAGNTTSKDATDATIGESLQLKVTEKTPPVITITGPTTGSLLVNNKPTITWTITDDYWCVKSVSITLTIDSTVITTGITKTPITNGYNCSYTHTTALTDGSHTIKVDGKDNDGNSATQKTTTIKIDTVPPTLNVSSPANELVTNQKSCVVSGVTNDAISSPVTVTVKHNASAAVDVTVEANGSFSKEFSLVEGNNTFTVVSTDGAGKTSAVTRTVTLDTKAPSVSAVSLTPNPVDAGKTFIISVTVTD